jgi:histidyl-tRNA synthetase
MGGPPTYAVGFAIGEDRLLEVIPDSSPMHSPDSLRGPIVVAAAGRLPTSGSGVSQLISIVENLREHGLPAVEAGAKRDKVFSFAQYMRSPVVVFVGEAEIVNQQLSIRDVLSRETKTMPHDEAVQYLKDTFYSKVGR